MTILCIILGLLMLIAGFTNLFTPLTNFLAAGYLVGILLLVYGIANLIRAISDKEHFLVWIMSILSIIVGVVAIVRPEGTVVLDTVILYLLAADFLVTGILQIVLAIRSRGDRGWVLELIAGILLFLLGIFSFINPTFAAVTIGVMISFFFISTGLSLMTLGFAAGGADD